MLTLGEKTRDRREVADAGADEWEVTGSQSCGYNSHAKLAGEVLARGIGCPIDRDTLVVRIYIVEERHADRERERELKMILSRYPRLNFSVVRD